MAVSLRLIFRYSNEVGAECFHLQEIDEMADEWQPEPLVDALTDKQKLELDRIPVIQGLVGG